MTAKCPSCHHPVSEHAEFFCMHISCMCNMPKSTALANYERDVMKKKLDIAVEALGRIVGKVYPNGRPHATIAKEALDKIGEYDA